MRENGTSVLGQEPASSPKGRWEGSQGSSLQRLCTEPGLRSREQLALQGPRAKEGGRVSQGPAEGGRRRHGWVAPVQWAERAEERSRGAPQGALGPVRFSACHQPRGWEMAFNCLEDAGLRADRSDTDLHDLTAPHGQASLWPFTFLYVRSIF